MVQDVRKSENIQFLTPLPNHRLKGVDREIAYNRCLISDFPAVNQAECTVSINERICASELGLLSLVLICYVNIRNGL